MFPQNFLNSNDEIQERLLKALAFHFQWNVRASPWHCPILSIQDTACLRESSLTPILLEKLDLFINPSLILYIICTKITLDWIKKISGQVIQKVCWLYVKIC